MINKLNIMVNKKNRKIISWIGLFTNALCCYSFVNSKIYLFLSTFIILILCSSLIFKINKEEDYDKIKVIRKKCLYFIKELKQEKIKLIHINFFSKEFNRIESIHTSRKLLEYNILYAQLKNYIIKYKAQIIKEEDLGLQVYFDTLEMNSTKDILKIKKQYRKISKKYHPDLNKEIIDDTKIKNINNAYAYLKKALCA